MSLKQFKPARRLSRKEEAQDKYDKAFLTEPLQFDPERSARSRKINTYLKIIVDSLPAQSVCDLGAGTGWLSAYCVSKGSAVTAVDVSQIALEQCHAVKEESRIHAYVPYTPLPDDEFSLVLACDLIAELPKEEHRLFVSEIARILHPDGKTLISTPLDIYTEDPLPKLLSLLSTDLKIESVQLLHHGLQIKLLDLLMPFKKLLSQSDSLLKLLEICQSWFQNESTASYAMIIASRK